MCYMHIQVYCRLVLHGHASVVGDGTVVLGVEVLVVTAVGMAVPSCIVDDVLTMLLFDTIWVPLLSCVVAVELVVDLVVRLAIFVFDVAFATRRFTVTALVPAALSSCANIYILRVYQSLSSR